MSEKSRFVIMEREGSELTQKLKVIVDRETGVNYLFTASGYAGGLTPLLNRDGKPIVTDDFETYY